MLNKKYFFIFILSIVILIASVAMFSANRYWYRFPGLFYFEPSFLGCAILLLMVRYGLKLQFGLDNEIVPLKILREANVYSAIIVVILVATSAIQYTPFNPIDKKILVIEHYLHLDLKSAIAWLSAKSDIKFIANIIYESLGYQVLIVPILVLLWRRYDIMYEFNCLVLISWLIGSTIYYFFPTTGPASVIDSPYFIESQRATGLKFWQLHHYIQPVTADGGLIAMPSFHVIWAWLCVYLVRPWPIIFGLLGLTNVLVAVSCVLLGWHYFLDIIVSILTMLLSHYIFYVFHKQRAELSVQVIG